MNQTVSSAGMIAWPVALLRIYAGLLFIRHGWGKLAQGSEFAGKMEGFLNAQADNSYTFYWPVIENLILPNSQIFGFLVSWGEFLVGVALLLGLATRWAGFAGAFMMLNFFLAKGDNPFSATSFDVVWLVIFLVLALLPAGRVLGLDARLSGRYAFLR